MAMGNDIFSFGNHKLKVIIYSDSANLLEINMNVDEISTVA